MYNNHLGVNKIGTWGWSPVESGGVLKFWTFLDLRIWTVPVGPLKASQKVGKVGNTKSIWAIWAIWTGSSRWSARTSSFLARCNSLASATIFTTERLARLSVSAMVGFSSQHISTHFWHLFSCLLTYWSRIGSCFFFRTLRVKGGSPFMRRLHLKGSQTAILTAGSNRI